MPRESLPTLALYALVSLAVCLAFYLTSRSISGVRRTPRRFWCFFVLLVLWGAGQLSVARYGCSVLQPPSKGLAERDCMIRWVAFVSAVLQMFCLPSSANPEPWFSRKATPRQSILTRLLRRRDQPFAEDRLSMSIRRISKSRSR